MHSGVYKNFWNLEIIVGINKTKDLNTHLSEDVKMANKQVKNAQHHIVKKIQNICDETNIYHNGHSKNTIK